MYALFGFGRIISEYRKGSIMRSIFGVASEKFHALEHPYPSRMDWINKFGYDPKQLHHLIRLNEFIKTGEVKEQSEIFEEFDITMSVIDSLLIRSTDSEGKIHISWGSQRVTS
jgi:hypothetical protein